MDSKHETTRLLKNTTCLMNLTTLYVSEERYKCYQNAGRGPNSSCARDVASSFLFLLESTILL